MTSWSSKQLTYEYEVDGCFLMIGSVCVAMSFISTDFFDALCTINTSVSAYIGSLGPQATAFSIDTEQKKQRKICTQYNKISQPLILSFKGMLL